MRPSVSAVVSAVLLSSSLLCWCGTGASSDVDGGIAPAITTTGGLLDVTPVTKKREEFGHDMLEYFQLDPAYLNINHGSFGCVPKEVWEYQQVLMERQDAVPDYWFQVEYVELMNSVRDRLATFLGVNSKDLVLVENASSAVNSILRSLVFAPGDKILYYNTEYAMTKNVLEYLAAREGIEPIQMDLSFPIESDEGYLAPLRTALQEHPDARLVIVSHISSTPAIVAPVQAIGKLCKLSGVPVLVDGAHSFGQIPFDISTMEVQYYLANAHKWFYSARGATFLWIHEDYQEGIVPTVISSNFVEGKYLLNFGYTGSRDYTAFLTVDASFDFRARYGEDAIMDYMHDLAWRGGNYLALLWNTTLLSPESMMGSMVDVQLPVASPEEAEWLSEQFWELHNANLRVYSFADGTSWTRISCQIFLEFSDIQNVGNWALEILDGAKKAHPK